MRIARVLGLRGKGKMIGRQNDANRLPHSEFHNFALHDLANRLPCFSGNDASCSLRPDYYAKSSRLDPNRFSEESETIAAGHLQPQPGASVSPVVFGSCGGYAQSLGRPAVALLDRG